MQPVGIPRIRFQLRSRSSQIDSQVRCQRHRLPVVYPPRAPQSNQSAHAIEAGLSQRGPQFRLRRPSASAARRRPANDWARGSPCMQGTGRRARASMLMATQHASAGAQAQWRYASTLTQIGRASSVSLVWVQGPKECECCRAARGRRGGGMGRRNASVGTVPSKGWIGGGSQCQVKDGLEEAVSAK